MVVIYFNSLLNISLFHVGGNFDFLKVTLKVTLKVMLQKSIEALTVITISNVYLIWHMIYHFRAAEQNNDDGEAETKHKNLQRGRSSQMEMTVSVQNQKTGGWQTTLQIEQGSSKLMVKMSFNKNSSEDNMEVPDSARDKKKNKKHVKDKEKELISDSEQSPKPKKAKKDKEKELVSETEGMPKPKKKQKG